MLKLNNPYSDYPYVYETHLHTNAASKCGRSTPEEMVHACKDAGYTGIFVTEHFYYGNTSINRKLPWEDWVSGYCSGYERAKAEGDKIDLQVFFAWEASYTGTDFLIYGLDKDWLIKHEEIKDASIREQYEIIHRAGGMVVHAHPFREEFYIPEVRLFPEYVDAIEVINASHLVKYPDEKGSSPFDIRAFEYARKYNFPETEGSDIHDINLFLGGIAFKEKLTDVNSYIKKVLNREGKILPLVEYPK